MFTYEKEITAASGKTIHLRVVESPHYTAAATEINRLLLHALDTQEKGLIALVQVRPGEWRVLLTRYGAIAHINNLRSTGQDEDASKLFAIYQSR